MAGGMDVKKNHFIEDYGARRENLEKVFRFNGRTLTMSLAFGVAIPVLVYMASVAEFVSF